MTGKRKKARGRPRALTPKQERRAAALYVAGWSQADIADDMGVDPATIRRICRAAGVKKSDRITENASQPRPDLRTQYEEVGEPPIGDPIASQEWVLNNLLVQMRRITTDRDYSGSEEEREKAMRELGKTIGSIVPKATIAKAVKIIKGDRKALGKKKGPEVERVSGDKRRRSRRSDR